MLDFEDFAARARSRLLANPASGWNSSDDDMNEKARMIPHGVAGVLCGTAAAWRAAAQGLAGDRGARLAMGRVAAQFAREELCDAGRHRASWLAALESRPTAG